MLSDDRTEGKLSTPGTSRMASTRQALGRWQQVLMEALAEHKAVGVSAVVAMEPVTYERCVKGLGGAIADWTVNLSPHQHPASEGNARAPRRELQAPPSGTQPGA